MLKLKSLLRLNQCRFNRMLCIYVWIATFGDGSEKAHFYYSLDGNRWARIGSALGMEYTLPHFMGYRFALFNFATINAGGYVDFDYYRVGGEILSVE